MTLGRRFLPRFGQRPGRALGVRVGAGVAVTWGADVLLVQRRDNGRWDVPGGAVNAGEAVEAAASRELREETGLDLPARALKLLGVFSGAAHRHTYPDGNTVDWVTVLYRHDLPDIQRPAVQAGDDARDARFWPRRALPDELSAATLAYLGALLAPLPEGDA